MGRGTLGYLARAGGPEAQSPRCWVASGGGGPGGSPDSSPRVSPTSWWRLGVLWTGVSSAGRQAVPGISGVSGFWVSCFKVFRDTWRAGWWRGGTSSACPWSGQYPPAQDTRAVTSLQREVRSCHRGSGEQRDVRPGAQPIPCKPRSAGLVVQCHLLTLGAYFASSVSFFCPGG